MTNQIENKIPNTLLKPNVCVSTKNKILAQKENTYNSVPQRFMCQTPMKEINVAAIINP